MQKSSQGLRPVTTALFALIVLGALAGVCGAYARLHIEDHNRRIEIALEWDEVSRLAQAIHQPVGSVLTAFQQMHVSTLVLQEDTFTTLEQAGAVHPVRTVQPDGRSLTRLSGLSPALYARIVAALRSRGIPEATAEGAFATGPETGFTVGAPKEGEAGASSDETTYVPLDYSNLRTIGIGLPPEGRAAAQAAGMRIAGRIGNFPGVNDSSAADVLTDLAHEGASTVIFNGEEVLGYRGLEKDVAAMLGGPPSENVVKPLPIALAYGAVEFGKQKGDEKLSADLKGDFVRVHSIQTGELGQMDEVEAIDRFVKAAKERNIRFCYVRLLTFAGNDPLKDNVDFLRKITHGMQRGNILTGGGLGFGAARRYEEPHTPTVIFPVIGLGVAAGTVWMLTLLCPLPERRQWVLLLALALLCMGMAAGLGETGRKLVALLGGISFPAAACLYYYPGKRSWPKQEPLSSWSCALSAAKMLFAASLLTGVGILHVVGLLATRTFMVHASQFMGIKAQHAVPLLIVLLAAMMGGIPEPGERWARYKARAGQALREALNEPARYGMLLFGIVALSALALVIARTGNDAGVGVSGIELKARAILEWIMPVRPRTKEFLVGHPAFLLGLAWWLRGRRKLAIPAFVIGSLGQVSLLNTFCHIHTPLAVSLLRDLTGLILGTLLGGALFLVVERFAPPVGTEA